MPNYDQLKKTISPAEEPATGEMPEERSEQSRLEHENSLLSERLTERIVELVKLKEEQNESLTEIEKCQLLKKQQEALLFEIDMTEDQIRSFRDKNQPKRSWWKLRQKK